MNNLLYSPPLGNSDHVCIEFDLTCYLELKKSENFKYNISAANLDLMKRALGNIDWESVLDTLNTNDAWKLFKTIFQDLVDKHVPTYKQREKKSLYSNSEVFSLKKHKNRLWKRYLSTRCPVDLSNFKLANNQLRSLTRNLKKNYESQLIQNIKSKPKAFWQYVNSRVKTRPGITELLRSDGSIASSDVEMATMFNDYFSSVFTREDTSSFPVTDTTSTPLISDSIEFTPEIVNNKILSLPNSKSPGPDGWPIPLIKSLSEFISIPLSIIFNKSFNSGSLPNDWKNAQVIPIHKKCARSQACNYRPVSLTSIFCKFMESIIKDHLMSHLLANNLLSDHQFGFIPGRSCTTQLLYVLDHFTKHLDKGEPIDVIYLDFQKAFDSVPHQRLIQKLTSFGINSKILQWIKDFLWNRTQQVVLNGQKSSTTSVTSGVPQGSVLGPVLFTLFVNDIPSMVSSPTFMFADDTKIFRCVKSGDDHGALQNDLNLLYEWSVRWQLKFNILKCKHIHFGPVHDYGPYYLNGVIIDSVDSQKDLGILFDNQLKFHHHTTTIVTKANRLLGLIKRSFDHLDSDMLTKLFVTIVRPIIEYGNSIWGPSFILDQRKIEKVQRRATKLLPAISDKPYEERLSILQLPSLTHRRRRGDMILLYKILNNYFNSDFSTLYAYSTTNTTRGHQFKLFKYRSRLNCRSNYFFNRVINDWNNLPHTVVNASSLNNFKYLIDSYLRDSRFTFV